ncbi:C-glycoside deglycosidase beta subunit domain-containing protein [Neobacillus niacini]|uniref:C-glycoside deglycosidase beta subunit domain-containing protein n=1 Tax=Neobacillus niacini TaxID=86668 RepID=UPI002FFFAF56
MAFSMRLPFVDVVCDDSLVNTYVNGKKLGYEFQIRLSNYRGHFLSCIEEFVVTVDGNEVNSDDITFCLNEKEFTLRQLPSLISEFWNLIEPATIKVFAPGGLTEGEHYIDVKLMLRIPYMAVPGSEKEHDYAKLDSCGSKALAVRN